jgi:16S rRNA (guanine966-N2)-methyltransferase
MRIIGGKFKGLKLLRLNGTKIRPTSDRLKESLFSIITSNKYKINIDGSDVLDICSGTGSLGIEAFSRGAISIHFIDKDQKSINLIYKNIAKLNIDGQIQNNFKIIKDEATKALKYINKIFQIVLIDPPYNTNITEKCLFKLKEFNLINQDSYIFAESSKTETFNYEGYQILDIKIYGNSKLTILKLLSSSSIK